MRQNADEVFGGELEGRKEQDPRKTQLISEPVEGILIALKGLAVQRMASRERRKPSRAKSRRVRTRAGRSV